MYLDKILIKSNLGDKYKVIIFTKFRVNKYNPQIDNFINLSNFWEKGILKLYWIKLCIIIKHIKFGGY